MKTNISILFAAIGLWLAAPLSFIEAWFEAMSGVTTTGCTVRLTSDSWSTASSQTDASAAYAQTVSFTVGSGAHEAWIECPNGKPLFWSKTL